VAFLFFNEMQLLHWEITY